MLKITPADECQAMLTWSEIRLRDAENETLSIHGRVDAVFESIYANLWMRARGAGYPAPAENPSEPMLLVGAKLADLTTEQTAKVLQLMYFIGKNRHLPKIEAPSLPYLLNIATELAHLSYA